MSKMNKNPLIYITNDDGPNTKGLNKLIEIVSEITDNYLVVVPKKESFWIWTFNNYFKTNKIK